MYRGSITPDHNGNQRIEIHKYNWGDCIEDNADCLRCLRFCDDRYWCREHPLCYTFVTFLICLTIGVVPLVDASLLVSSNDDDIPAWIIPSIGFFCAIVSALFFCKALKGHDIENSEEMNQPPDRT